MGEQDETSVYDNEPLPEVIEAVTIMPELIQDEFVRVVPALARFNHVYAVAQKRFMRAQYNLKRLEAELYVASRNAIIEMGGKPTEAMIEAAVRTAPAYQACVDELVEAEFGKAEAYGNVDAIRTKKEMLISLGAHIRSELDGDPATRERSRGRRLLDEQEGHHG
jgi:hypothetical protein